MEMTTHKFLGCVNGTWKDEKTGRETPTFTIYLGVEMKDKNGNDYGYGYKPCGVKVDKDTFNQFTTLSFGDDILAEIFKYQNKYGNWSCKLMRYEF